MISFNTRRAVALLASLFLVVGLGCTDDDTGAENGNDYQEDVVDDTDPDNGDNGDTDANGDQEDADNDSNQYDVDPVECPHPSDDDPECPSGNFGPASFFSHFSIVTDDDPGCCFDLTGNGNINNLIGEDVVPAVEQNLDGFDDVNANIETSIETGDLAYLLEASYWDHPEWDDDLELYVHLGGDTDDDMSTILDGNGSFRVADTNFDGDGDRRFGFDEVTVTDGVLEASGGTVAVMFPGLVEELVVTLGDVHLEGEVIQSPEPDLRSGGNFAIRSGKMGGALMRDDFYTSMNDIAHECDCIDDDYEDPDNPDPWSEGVFTYNEDNDNWSCLDGKVTGDQCNEPGTPAQCQTLGDQDFCSLMGPFSSPTFTDVQVDGEHGYSVGLHFRSVTTEIIGID